MAQTDLRRVSKARKRLEQAQRELNAAIIDATASGETYRDVGREAGLSYQRVGQIVKGEHEK